MAAETAKKNELNNGSAENIQHIKPFLPNDAAVIKRTDGGGNIVFHGQNSKDEIRTSSTDLETELMCLLDPLEIIEKALAYAEQNAFANSLTIARQNIANAIHEIFRFVNNNIGEINITSVHELETNSIYRWGQCVDAELLPPDTSGNQEEGPIYNHNPKLIDFLKQISPDKTENLETVMRILRDGGSICFRPGDNGNNVWEIQNQEA